MAVDINWGLATAQPNMLALAQEGFQAGRAQKMQGIQDQALAKISANPNDASAINALLPVNPGLYGQLTGALQQRQQAEQQATRQQAIGGALSQLDGLPEPVRMLAQSDPEGAMQLWEMTGKMDAQQQAAATANAEKLAAVVTGLAELPPEQRFAQAVQLAPQFGLDPARITPESLSDQGIQAILAQAMGVKGVLDYRMKEREFQFNQTKFGADQQYRAESLGVQRQTAAASAANAAATQGLAQAQFGLKMEERQEAATEKARAKEAAKSQSIAKAQTVLTGVGEALSMTGTGTAGLGSGVMRGIGGTKAADLAATIDTLQANLSFGELAAMRAASPSGGALGAVSERELALLGSTVASINPNQSPTQLKANLVKVARSYARWQATVEGVNPDTPAGQARVKALLGPVMPSAKPAASGAAGWSIKPKG